MSTAEDDYEMCPDLSGRIFNRITVIGPRDPSQPISAMNDQWMCVCDCTKDDAPPRRKFVVYRCRLIKGNTQSCGCLSRQRLSEGRTKHGMCSVKNPHRLYDTWSGMLERCRAPNHSMYRYYGARGIKVCERWNEFKNFVEDMWPSWQEGKTLDRRETDKNYDPDNCIWSTPKEQQNNRRCCHRITIDGVTKTVTQWAEEKKIKVSTIFGRIRNGWSEHDSVMTPAAAQEHTGPAGDLTHNGKTQSVPAWASEIGIKSNVLYLRLKAGWTHERILTTPVRPMRAYVRS